MDLAMTAVTGLLCWRDFHPLEWQLASLHQIRMCRVPASGSSWRSFARGGVIVTMDDPGYRQRVTLRSAMNRLQWSLLPRSHRDSHFCQILAT
jgi:hypothetical protein